MIYDCFTFLNELDLLEIRFEELDGVVDFFVLVEATKTFSNKQKPLYYQENTKRFKRFYKKVIHVIVEDMPEDPKNAWEMEYFQRNAITRGLLKCRPDDMIIIADVDEIPRSNCVKEFKSTMGIFRQNLYHFKFNCENIFTWNCCAILQYQYLTTPQQIRDLTLSEDGVKKFQVIPNGGWHFSSLGTPRTIRYKWQSFSHQEFNSEKIISEKVISQKMQNAEYLIPRDDFMLFYTTIDKTFPLYMYTNRKKFNWGIKRVSSQEKVYVRKIKILQQMLYERNSKILELERLLKLTNEKLALYKLK